ncbi:NADPH-dependent FMN reductase [Sorangium sp. So ce321]|uniref:NADPH-dependent FMN reductase n=1 Tax=Sorangium sp. So ce321 TaxID=3133300 RepID=UPI003F618AC8
MRILGICGSLQARSSNLMLLHTARAMAPEGVELVLYDGIRELPFFNPDIEASGAPPAVGEWRRAIAASDALLIASPEYGHSLPGALKNAIDWVIGTGELERKVVGVTAATVSPERGRLGLQALRGTLGAVSARVVGGEPIARGPSFERELAALLGALIDAARAGPTSEP